MRNDVISRLKTADAEKCAITVGEVRALFDEFKDTYELIVHAYAYGFLQGQNAVSAVGA